MEYRQVDGDVGGAAASPVPPDGYWINRPIHLRRVSPKIGNRRHDQPEHGTETDIVAGDWQASRSQRGRIGRIELPPRTLQLLALRDARRHAWRAAGHDPARFRDLMAAWIQAGKPPVHTWPDRDTPIAEVNAALTRHVPVPLTGHAPRHGCPTETGTP